MTNDILSAYRSGRAEGYPPASALRMARLAKEKPESPIEWQESDGYKTLYKARWSDDRFNFYARMVEDHEDFDQSGKFTDKWEPGAICHKDAYIGLDYYGEPRFSRDICRYFIPKITEAEHYKGYREMKYGKRQAHDLARKHAHDDYKRACEQGEEWGSVGIIVKVFDKKDRTQLAESSCGGFSLSYRYGKHRDQYEEDMEYLKYEAEEIAFEARYRAMKTTEDLMREYAESTGITLSA